MNPYKLIIIFLLSLAGFNARSQNLKSDKLRIKADLGYLASDSLEGRAPGTTGDSLAAFYIADQLLSAGFTPLIGESMVIPFLITLRREVAPEAAFITGNVKREMGCEFAVLPISSTARVKGRVIRLEEADSKYQTVNRDSSYIALIKSHPDSVIFRVTPLVQAGFSAVIFYYDDSLNTGRFSGGTGVPVPVIQIRAEVAGELVMSPGLICEVYTKVNVIKARTFNVLATNTQKEGEIAFLAGAHYDHLGYGGEGSGSMYRSGTAIHNGADDNASGVSAVMELGRVFGESAGEGVKFAIAAFGAEERGLIGSRIVADTLQKLGLLPRLMLNYDMIGRLEEERIQIGGTGTFNGADSLVNLINEEFNFSIAKTAGGHGPSDHSSFYSKEVPVLYFSTGVHKEYHTPDDTADLINYNGIARITDFTLALLASISDSGFTPNYVKIEMPQMSSARSFRVTLGVIPDFTYDKGDGFRVASVSPGRTASKSGVKDGDIISVRHS